MNWFSNLFARFQKASPEPRAARFARPALTRLEDRDTPSSAVLGDFGNSGLWVWKTDTNSWSRLTPSNAEGADVSSRGAFGVGDFGASGLWRYASGAWTNLTPANAEQAVIADDGSVAADFGASGLWRWTSAGGWKKLANANPEQIDISDDHGNVMIFADFGRAGLLRWSSQFSSWYALSASNAEHISASPNNGVVVADLGGGGCWAWDDHGTQIKLDSRNPTAVAVGEDGVPAAVFGDGVWMYSGAWTRLTPAIPQNIAMGKNLAADYGSSGLWFYDTGWRRITTANAEQVWVD
jgi:hypothetical protein